MFVNSKALTLYSKGLSLVSLTFRIIAQEVGILVVIFLQHFVLNTQSLEDLEIWKFSHQKAKVD